MKVKSSLANTDRKYAEVQLAPYEGNDVHVQVNGQEGNRDYGFAITFENAELRTALSKVAFEVGATLTLANPTPPATQKRFAKSLYGSERMYVLGQAASYGNGRVHFQLPSDAEINRDYGFATTVNVPALAAYLEEVLNGEG